MTAAGVGFAPARQIVRVLRAIAGRPDPRVVAAEIQARADRAAQVDRETRARYGL